MFFYEIWYDYPCLGIETYMIRFMNLVEIVGRVHPLFSCFVPEIFGQVLNNSSSLHSVSWVTQIGDKIHSHS